MISAAPLRSVLTWKKSARLRLPCCSMQSVPSRQTSSYFIGCGETLTSVFAGGAPVTAPLASVGQTSCDMKTFQRWPDFELGSAFLSEPYQTASARPGPPAWIHGMMFTASPVLGCASLICTGADHFVHPLAALD